LAESAPLVWDRVKVFENLGATTATLVVPADTFLICSMYELQNFGMDRLGLSLEASELFTKNPDVILVLLQ
jgi:hypothetical protein